MSPMTNGPSYLGKRPWSYSLPMESMSMLSFLTQATNHFMKSRPTARLFSLLSIKVQLILCSLWLRQAPCSMLDSIRTLLTQLTIKWNNNNKWMLGIGLSLSHGFTYLPEMSTISTKLRHWLWHQMSLIASSRKILTSISVLPTPQEIPNSINLSSLPITSQVESRLPPMSIMDFPYPKRLMRNSLISQLICISLGRCHSTSWCAHTVLITA